MSVVPEGLLKCKLYSNFFLNLVQKCFVYFNLMKFLMISVNSKTIYRSESSVFSSPIGMWSAHINTLFSSQSQLAVLLSSSAQASSSAEASVSWFPKALNKIKTEWLSTYPTYPNRSTDKENPSFLVQLKV